MNTQAFLQHSQTAFGKAPRSGISARHLSIPQPDWAKQDKLNLFFQNQRHLWKNGYVTWGHIVQANSNLFHPGIENYPAETVYCSDPQRSARPEALSAVAEEIYRLKNTQPDDRQLAKFAALITDEYGRHFGVPVPKKMSPEIPTAMSVVYIARHHLPNGYLSRSYFPMIVADGDPKVVMILPCRYWSAAMVQWWIDDRVDRL